MRRWLVAVVLTACQGDAPPNVDANPLGPRCSTNVYDLCFEEHDCNTCDGCQSRVCQNFAADGFQICSLGCVPGGTPCPDDKNGTPGTCDNGVCKPSVPNMCHL